MATITYKTTDQITNINNLPLDGGFFRIQDRGVDPGSGDYGTISLDYYTWSTLEDIENDERPFVLKNSDGVIVEGISSFALTVEQITNLLSTNYPLAIASILSDVLGYEITVIIE